ncbi:MAG: ketopantoate reductase family protein [Hyphomicrobium sp.]
MQVVVLGAGGVGGYLGARLIAGGADVAFLVREGRAAQLRSGGLILKSPLGDFSSPVKVLTAGAAPDSVPDAVILACKEPALAAALDEVTPLLGPTTRLLPVLNGVRHLDILQARFPGTPLLGGIVHGATNLRPDGVIEHLSPFMTVIAGPVEGASDPVSSELVDRLKVAGVDAYATHEIRQDMWNKFVFLAAFAGITCLMRASIGTILATDGGRETILALLEETRSIAEAEGFSPPDQLMDEYRTLLTQEGSALTSSMLRDIEAGRRTEGAHILGDMLARARRHGLQTPVLGMAATHVAAHELRLKS